MGEDSGSRFPWHRLELQSPDLYSPGPPFHSLSQDKVPGLMNSGTNLISVDGNFPVCERPLVPQFREGLANDLRGWFYCLPRFRQAFIPSSTPILKEQSKASPNDVFGESMAPKGGPGCAQKRFLVFDQSGCQTRLIFSSGVETRNQHFTPLGPKFPGVNREVPQSKEELKIDIGMNSMDEVDGIHGTDVESEMREDTEELNALLYSDDSDGDGDYTEDDEVTSTGHSPSTMTAHGKQGSFEGSTGGMSSYVGPSKKRKLFDHGDHDLHSLLDTASSVNPCKCAEYEDDAESSCGNHNREIDLLSSENKRLRREKIRETVSVLRSIIPNGEDKDPMVVLDEAIDYLKSLKLKAKALGLNAL